MRLLLTRKKACHDRVCTFLNIGIEEFTSLLRERAFALRFLLAAHHVSCSRFCSASRSNFVASCRAGLSSPFGRTSIRADSMSNAKQTAAVNYLLYTALALEPILNDPSNLVGEERGRGRVEGEWTRLSILYQEVPKIHGGHEDHETTSARRRGRGRRRRDDARWTEKDLSENHLIFQRSRHVAREVFSSFCLSLCLEESRFVRE